MIQVHQAQQHVAGGTGGVGPQHHHIGFFLFHGYPGHPEQHRLGAMLHVEHGDRALLLQRPRQVGDQHRQAGAKRPEVQLAVKFAVIQFEAKGHGGIVLHAHGGHGHAAALGNLAKYALGFGARRGDKLPVQQVGGDQQELFLGYGLGVGLGHNNLVQWRAPSLTPDLYYVATGH